MTPEDAEWLIGASYGPDARGLFEITETNGEWSLARGEVTLGGTRPTLPVDGHVDVSGELPELDLDPWLILGMAGSLEPAGLLSRIGRIALQTAGARVFGRRVALQSLELGPAADGSGFHVRLGGPGVAGEVLLPADPASGRAHIHFERLHFGPPPLADENGDVDSPDDDDTAEIRLNRWPSFDARIDSMRFDKIALGAVRAIGKRSGDGLEIEELSIDSPDLRVRGHGSWLVAADEKSASRFKVELYSGDISRFLSAARGAVEVRLDLAWPGSPIEPSLEQMEGEIEMDAEDGHLPRVRVGPAGRLLSLLSLDAVPRVLALDLSHVFGKGLAYDRIVVRMQLEDGTAKLRELILTGPTARVEVDGGLDLISRRYDQEVSVIPRLTRSGALLPAWAAVWPVLVGNFLLEKISGDKIILDRLFRLRYRVQGAWDDPEIERIKTSTAATGK